MDFVTEINIYIIIIIIIIIKHYKSLPHLMLLTGW